MTRTSTAWIIAGVWVIIALGPQSGPVQAQSALERLESQLRKQLGVRGTGDKPETSKPPNSTSASGKSGAAPADAAAAPLAEPAFPQPPQANERPRPYLGIVVDDQNDRGRGVRVLDVLSDGPGAKAGLQNQDLLTSISGMRVRQLSEMADILDLYAPGDKATFEVLRNGKPLKVEFVLGQRPVDPAQPKPPTLSDLNPATRSKSAAPAPSKPREPALPPPPTVVKTEATPPSSTTTVAEPVTDDTSRVKQLEQRIEQLEKRLAELERTVAGKGASDAQNLPQN